jgi:zinc protease
MLAQGGIMKSRKSRAILALLSLAAAQLFGAPAGASPVAHKVLANGLEVFVVENRAVPLATICVAFRGGASAQTPETAGLFHLYEHMLFAANEKYPNQASFSAALNRMGVPNWNGATSTEYINYYITVPSDKLEEGVEFWSWAVRKPVFDPAKLEAEKDVVVSEIRGYHVDPNRIADNALESRMFTVAPWRKNVDGPEENIKRTEAAELERIRGAFYIPKNTALMIGGDVSAEYGFMLAEEYFGDWTGAEKPVIGVPPQGPIPAGVKLVYPDENFYRGVAQVEFRWRGPDVLRQTKDTYVSDVLLFLLTSPVGRFKDALMEKGPGLYDAEYIDFGYPTARDGGAFQFQTFLELGEGAAGPSIERVEKLRALVLEEFATIARDPEAYFGPVELEKAKTKLIDQNILSMEVASSFLTGTLTFWWSVATTDYFYGYEDECRKVSYADIADLIRRYLTGASPDRAPAVASALRLREDAYEEEAGLAEAVKTSGYLVVGPDNAFWWQK